MDASSSPGEQAIRDAFSADETYEDELKPSWSEAPMQGIPFVSEQLHDGALTRRLVVARCLSSTASHGRPGVQCALGGSFAPSG